MAAAAYKNYGSIRQQKAYISTQKRIIIASNRQYCVENIFWLLLNVIYAEWMRTDVEYRIQ